MYSGVTFLNVYIGMQVLYIPDHVVEQVKFAGDEIIPRFIAEDIIERGFVTSYGQAVAFCRFYYNSGEMRTTSCSPSCMYKNLFIAPEGMLDQEEINRFISANYSYQGGGQCHVRAGEEAGKNSGNAEADTIKGK